METMVFTRTLKDLTVSVVAMVLPESVALVGMRTNVRLVITNVLSMLIVSILTVHTVANASLVQCKNGTAESGRNSRCLNTRGDYDCECLPGYKGDGFTYRKMNKKAKSVPHAFARKVPMAMAKM